MFPLGDAIAVIEGEVCERDAAAEVIRFERREELLFRPDAAKGCAGLEEDEGGVGVVLEEGLCCAEAGGAGAYDDDFGHGFCFLLWNGGRWKLVESK